MTDSLWRKRLTRDDTEHGKHYYLADDDDIQDYKKPWVGLTDEEVDGLWEMSQSWNLHKHFYVLVECLLKQKNT
jgi:hypothetical protein